MKTKLVQAFVEAGKDVNGKAIKTLVGERTIQVPENVEEALSVYGSEMDILEYAAASYVIEVQTQLRTGSSEKSTKRAMVNKLFARAEAGDEKAIALLRGAGIEV